MTKRKTTRQSNPRYLISRDGIEVGFYPGFTSVEAIKRAKMHYGAGKYTAEKVDSSMYLGRGAERTQARERRERQEAHHAERMEMAKRSNGTHIHAEMIDHLDVAKVHNPSKYTDLYLDENSQRGKGMGLTPATYLNYTLKGKAKQYSDSYLRALIRDLKTRPDVIADQSHKGGVAYYRIMENPRPEIDHATAQTIYHNANSTGLGFAIGDEYDDIGEAAVNAGWRVLERYDISLLRAADSAGNEFLVGGNGMGQGAWVIGLPYDVETEVEYET